MAIISTLLAAGVGNTQLMLNYNDNNLTAQAFVLSCDKDAPYSMKWWCTLAGNDFSGIVRQGTMAEQFPIASYGIQGQMLPGRDGKLHVVFPFSVIGMSVVSMAS